jgi:hypothetical protein
MMAEPVTTYTEALAPIRERVGSVLKIKYNDFDLLCSFPEGLTGKVFGPSQVKRLGIEKFFDAIRGVGLRIRFEEDPEQLAKMLERVAQNYRPRQANQARMNNRSHLCNGIIDEVLAYLANNKGGLTRLNLAVKEARSNRARRASKAFWKKKRQCGPSDFSTYADNVLSISKTSALPSPAENPCGAEANAA